MPAYDIDGIKHTVAKPSSTASKTSPTAPKLVDTFYFNGRTYTSYAAYIAAVNAYNAALAKRRAAEASARQQAALRQQAQRRTELARQQAAASQAALQQVTARRQAELAERERRAAAARREAFEALQARHRRILEARADRDRRSDLTRRAAGQFAREEQRVARTTDPRIARMGERVSVADVRRGRLLESARASGDFSEVFDFIRRRQMRTGGRYVDQKLFDQAQKESLKLLADVQGQRDSLVGKVYEAFEAEDWRTVVALTDSPEWKATMERFAQYFGDGTVPGMAERWRIRQSEISRDRNRWVDSWVVGGTTRRVMSEREIRNAERSFQQDHLQRRVLPGRTQRLEGNIEEVSLTDWLRGEEQRQRALDLDAFRASNEYIRNAGRFGMRAGGIDALVQPLQGGRFVSRAAIGGDRDFRTVRELLVGDGRGWKGIIGEAEFARLMNDLNNGLPVDRERATARLTELGMEAYRRRDGELWARAGSRVRREDFGPGRQGDVDYAAAVMQAQSGGQEVSRRNLERILTGSVTRNDVLLALGRLGSTPGIEQGLGLYNNIMGGTTTAARLLFATLTGGGNLAFPDVQFDALFGSRNPFLSTPGADGSDLGAAAFDVTGAAKDRFNREARELLAVIGDPNTPLERRLDAINTFGRGWASGNTSMLTEQLLDPLSFVGGARFLRGGRLAAARAGGLRAALRAPGSTIDDFLKLSLPKGFGGMSEREIRALSERLRIARESGVDFRTVQAMSDEDLAGLAREALAKKTATEAAKGGAWEKYFESDPVQAQQLFSAVSRNAEELASVNKVRQVSAGQLQRDIDYARQAAARAEAEARAVTARTERRAAETAGADALEKLRAEQARLGVAKPVQRAPDALTPVLKGKRTRLVNQYERVVTERIGLARQAKDAAEALDTTLDNDARRIHFDRLEKAVARLRELDDQIETDPVTGIESVRDGAVSLARQAVQDFDRANRSGSAPRAFLDVQMPRVNADEKWIAGQIAHARARLSAVSKPTEIRHWANRLKRLGEARDYLAVERRRLRGAKAVGRRTMRKYAEPAKRAINLNRVVARATTPAAAKESLLRDLRRRVVGSTVTGRAHNLTDAERAILDAADADLARGALLSPDVSAELKALRAQFGDVNLIDLAYALWAGRDSLLGGMYDTWLSFRSVIRETIARERGLPLSRVSNADVDRLLENYGLHQAYSAAPMSLKRYRGLDEVVARAIEDARGWTARGQVNARRASKSPPQGAFVGHDRELAEIYAKLSTLKREGVGVEAYDQTRSVLRDINLRHNRGVTLRRRARQIAHRSGRSVDDVFDQLREKARLDEVAVNLEKLAYRYPELSEDEIFSLFELQMIDADLAPFTKRPITLYQEAVLKRAYAELSGGVDVYDDAEAMRLLGEGASEHPPFGNRAAMHEWMIEHGHFSPRTADAIRAGQRVFSVEAERDFWRSGYGYTPPWTDPAELSKILPNKELYDAKMREWGLFNDDFERIMASNDLSGEKLRNAMVFGTDGVKRARTWEELRSWAVQRYGDLVSADGVTLDSMPWLMNLDEYDDFLKRAVVQKDQMLGFGLEFDRTMIRPAQLDRFADAVSTATRKAFDRAKAAGEIDETWLPQEQVRFVMDVVDHLVADPRWRGFLDQKPLPGRVLDNIGAFWRVAMTWVPPFPIMNLLDSVGIKRGILAATQNGFRPLSRVSAAAREAIPTVDVLGDRAATWYVRGRNGFVNSLDSQFDSWMRVRELGRGFTELPVRLSKFGEDRLRLDFGRSMFDQRYGDLIAEGVDAELARTRALAFARSRVDDLFPDLSGASSFEKLINQLVPFFSYNLKLKVIGMRLAVENPWLVTLSERLGDFVEEQNRGLWESEHPGVPFPENDPSARWLWLKVGDTVYTVDLGSFSDLTRGLSVVGDIAGRPWKDVAGEFFRVPHPSQAIFLAVAFGFNDGKTPWGTEARWEDVTIWFDLASWMMKGGQSAFDPNDPRSRDAMQMWSQMLFFKSFGRISPMKAKVQQFFGFMALDPDRAWEYYQANDDLRAYFALNGSRYRIEPGVKASQLNWFTTASDAERARYDEAFDGFRHLRESLDADLDQYYLEPWRPEYRAAKRRRRALLTAYLKEHPVLGEAWGFGMTPREFTALQDEWLVDEQTDRFFALDDTKPLRTDFADGTAGELAFTKELQAWYRMRAKWLEAHPAVFDRLYSARTEVERAWFEHELQWSEILDRSSDVKIKLLELDLQLDSDPGDEGARALSGALYELQDANFSRLDAESFGAFYDLVERQRRRDLNAGSIGNRLLGRLRTVVAFPGRNDLEYANATPSQRAQMDADRRYAEGMSAVWDRIGDDASRFYDELRKTPWLLNEYWARNPEAKARYETGQAYRGWMGRWVEALDRSDFTAAQAIWDSMPPWVHDRYFSRHPDSKMRDGVGGGGSAVQYKGRWFKSAESRDRYIRFIENGSPSTAVEYNGMWFRSPESRDRYIRWIEGGQVGAAPPVDGEEIRFRSPESRQRFLDGQAYFAAMQTWVDLLRAKDFVAADQHFRSLPEWMKEKYYAKHPDQRAKNELDSQALRLGAEYFLAGDDATKLSLLQRNPSFRAWLDQHSGDEGAMRGLIFAIYRAIPKGEAWLKRTFRERHPEFFSKAAQGERRLAKVARALAEHPDMAPFYEKALALQTRTYLEQLKHNKVPPRPISIERKRRIRKRTKRRGARFSSTWSMHYEARRGLRNSAGT